MPDVIPKSARSLITVLGRSAFRDRLNWHLFSLYTMNRFYAWQRRRDLLHSPPIACASARERGAQEVFLTSGARHLVDAIYAAKSFIFHAGRPIRLSIIADASIDQEAIRRFEHHLPNVTILTKEHRDATIEKVLTEMDLPRCIAWRQSNVFGPKLIDPSVFCEGGSYIVLDSDIVTFRSLNEMFCQIEREPDICMFGHDRRRECYALPLSRATEELGVTIKGYVNAGFSYIARDAVNYRQLERWLENPAFPPRSRFSEQTFTAAFGTLHGCGFWDSKEFNMGRTARESECTLIHYCDYPISDTRLAMRQIGQRLFDQQLRQAHRRAQFGRLGDNSTGSSTPVAAVGDSS